MRDSSGAPWADSCTITCAALSVIIHGDQDTVVDVRQSRNMYKAMQTHNKQVEYIELQDGNHSMSIEANRLLVLSSFERFLNAHIPVLSE